MLCYTLVPNTKHSGDSKIQIFMNTVHFYPSDSLRATISFHIKSAYFPSSTSSSPRSWRTLKLPLLTVATLPLCMSFPDTLRKESLNVSFLNLEHTLHLNYASIFHLLFKKDLIFPKRNTSLWASTHHTSLSPPLPLPLSLCLPYIYIVGKDIYIFM